MALGPEVCEKLEKEEEEVSTDFFSIHSEASQ